MIQELRGHKVIVSEPIFREASSIIERKRHVDAFRHDIAVSCSLHGLAVRLLI